MNTLEYSQRKSHHLQSDSLKYLLVFTLLIFTPLVVELATQLELVSSWEASWAAVRPPKPWLHSTTYYDCYYFQWTLQISC